jgi:uncharacterized tellurite resistance protein B-like protein
MPTAIILFFVFVTAAVLLGILFGRFLNSPQGRWRTRVLERALEFVRRRQQLLAGNDNEAGDRIARSGDELFHRHLRSIPLEPLMAFPGIGPGTLDRLHSAGLRTLADLQGFDVQRIKGFGPTKAAELRVATRELIRQARSRFDAGGSPEGEEYRRQLAALQAGDRERAVAHELELLAVEDAIGRIAPLVDLTRRVTFRNFLLRREIPDLTEAVLNALLPEVERPQSPSAVPATPQATVPEVEVAGASVARPANLPVTFPPVLPTPKRPTAPDDLFRAELAKPQAAPSQAHDHPWLPKLRAYCRFAFALAKADGRIAQAEKKVIRTFLDQQFGHDPGVARHIDPTIERAEADIPPLELALEAVKAATTPAERAELYALAERIADASGERNERERDAIARIATAFEIAKQAPPRVVAPQPTVNHRAVLEIDPGTELSADLIRRKYTLLSEKLDPTKASALGPDFAAMAAEKRTRLRAAAEALIAPFGVPLDPPAAPPPPADLRHNPDLDDVFGA